MKRDEWKDAANMAGENHGRRPGGTNSQAKDARMHLERMRVPERLRQTYGEAFERGRRQRGSS